jgi:predicted transcriptional regulator YdeE
MTIEILNRELILSIYGFSGKVINNNYGQTGVALMDEMWKIVKGNHLKNKGTNIWVYNADNTMMAGVELDEEPKADYKLEQKTIHLTKYAYWKHIGPYNQLFDVNAMMRKTLSQMGVAFHHPCLEIYGHMHPDETKCETEIIWAVD